MFEKKNKRGSSIFVMLMLGVVFFVIGLALAPSIKEVTGDAMNDTSLNCSTTTDSQTKAICTSIDIQQWFIGAIFGFAGILVGRAAVS